MTFKIDFFSPSQNNKISFGPRTLGESGKDIIVIKMFLGLIKPLDDQGNYQAGQIPEDINFSVPLDTQNWFQCSNGKGVDSVKAATFDIELKSALSKYQIKHRLLITSFLFEKYFINNILTEGYENIESTEQFERYKLFVSDRYFQLSTLFDLEFGKIAEATIAVMHGYTPGRFFNERGYIHSNTIFENLSEVLSIVPEDMIDDLESGVFGSTRQELLNDSIITQTRKGLTIDQYDNFLRTASSSRNWIRLEPEPSAGEDVIFQYPFNYGLIGYPVQTEFTSNLFKYSQALMTAPDPTSLLDVDPSYKREQARKFFEPDPFVDPPPFIIDEERMGYFLKTKYVLDPNGELPSNAPEDIRVLEDIALEKVLASFGKPFVWNIFIKEGPEREAFINAYNKEPPNPGHAGILPATSLVKDSQRFSENPITLFFKSELARLENELQLLIEKRQPRENHPFPPVNFPGYSAARTLDQNTTAYIQYIDSIISEKKASIETKKIEIQNYPIVNKQSDYLVLTTETHLQKLENQSVAESWRSVDTNVQPLVKFIEYRTPSLRPTQEYRAYFEFSRKKLDLVQYESFSSIKQLRTSSQNNQEIPDDPAACYSNDSEQTLRTYEEYRTHAIKKRREIQRQFKEEYERYRDRQRRGLVDTDGEDLGPDNRTGRIDLGFAGPFNFNEAFSSVYGLNNVADDREYTRKIMSMAVNGSTGFFESMGWMDNSSTDLQQMIDTGSIFGGSGSESKRKVYVNNDLEITLTNLKQRLETAADDLRRAGQIMKREGIQLEKGSNFNAANEAQLLTRFYTELVEFLDSTQAGKNILQKASDINNQSKYLVDVIKTEDERTKKFSSLSDLPDIPPYINLKFKFANIPLQTPHPQGPKAGKRLVSLQVGLWNPALGGPRGNKIEYDYVNVPLPPLQSFETASRGRTVNYVAQVNYMTSPFGTASAKDVIVGFFDDGLNICQELGIDAEKHVSLALVGTYTTGIKVEKKVSEGFSSIFKKWTDKNFTNPAMRYADTSSANWKSSFKDTFDEDMALRSLGKLCTLEDIYDEFLDKFDIATLFCSYLECIKLPGFSLKLPKLVIPPFPKIPILGFYAALIRFLRNNMVQILTRIACSFARTIIDKLAFPFCEEQLEDFISAGSSASPLLSQALAQAFTDTGVYGLKDMPADGEEETPLKPARERAKDYFQDVAQIVTGEELCYLLEGKPLDDAGMLMLKTLAKNNNLGEDLDTSESVTNFFGVLGSYIPIDICNELSKISKPLGTACAESADPLKNIRNRLQSGDNSLTAQQTQDVLDIAKKNLEQQKESLNAVSGMTMDELLPDSLKAGNENLIVTSLPGPMKNQLQAAIENIFLPAKMSYLSALSSYVPSLSLESTRRPVAGDSDYNDESILVLECNLERLKNFASAVERSKINFLNSENFSTVDGNWSKATQGFLANYEAGDLEPSITPEQVSLLYTVFETEQIGPHTVHKRYRPKGKDYLVRYRKEDQRFDNQGNAIPDFIELFIEEDVGNNLDGGDDKFEKISYEEYLKFNYPEPTSDSTDEVFTQVYEDKVKLPSINRWNINQQSNSFNHRIVDGDLLRFFDPNVPNNRSETVLKPISIEEPFIENRDNSFPSYSEGDIPTNYRHKRFDAKINAAGNIGPNNQENSIYPRISIQKSSANEAAIDLQKPRNSFAFNCTFNILGCPSPNAFPEYFAEPERNDEGVITRSFVTFRDEYLERAEDWSHDICPFFSRNHIISKDRHYFVGNLSDSSTENTKNLIKPAVRELLLDSEQKGIVEMSGDSILESRILNSNNNPTPGATALKDHNWGGVLSGVPKVYHEMFMVNNDKLLQLASDRAQQLAVEIQAQLQTVQPNLIQEYLPIVRKVFQKVSNLSVWKHGNSKYITLEQQAGMPWPLTPALDYINLNFRATPYNPTIKMVEISTKNNKLDPYNIVIDQDQFLRQGIDSKVSKQDATFPSQQKETVESLNPKTSKIPGRPRFVAKYCDVLPDNVTEKNKHETTFTGENDGRDFSRREAFAQNMVSWLKNDIQVLNFEDLTEQAKTMGFKTAAETIFSSFMNNLSNSPLCFERYAASLNNRISSKAHVIEGTKCLKNRYSLNEQGTLSFRELFLNDAIKQIESEMRKPEFSPFNRSFGEPGPFPSAIKKIAFSAFVKACLIDGMLKSGLAFSVWGMEPIINEPIYIDYMTEHVRVELDRNTKMRYIWGQISEELVPGANNKSEALSAIVGEQLLIMPALSRQVYHPGMGYKDFFNWHHFGRGRDALGTKIDNINPPREGRNYYSKLGLFRRLPIPTKSLSIKESEDTEDKLFWVFQDYVANLRDAEEEYVFKENETQTIKSDNFSSSIRPTRKHKSVNEFILQDYIRITGKILDPINVDFTLTTPSGANIKGFHLFEGIEDLTSSVPLGSNMNSFYTSRTPGSNNRMDIAWLGFHMIKLVQNRIAYEVLREDQSGIPGASPQSRRDFVRENRPFGGALSTSWLGGNLFGQFVDPILDDNQGFSNQNGFMPRGFLGRGTANGSRPDSNDIMEPQHQTPDNNAQIQKELAKFGMPFNGELKRFVESSLENKRQAVIANLLISARIVETISRAFGIFIRHEIDSEFLNPVALSWQDVSPDLKQIIGLRLSVYPGMPLHLADIANYEGSFSSERTRKYMNNSYSDDGTVVSAGNRNALLVHDYDVTAGTDIFDSAQTPNDRRAFIEYRSLEVLADDLQENQDIIDFSLVGKTFSGQSGQILRADIADEEIEDFSRFDSLVLSLPEFDELMDRFSLRFLPDASLEERQEEFSNIIENSKFYHGVRLNNVVMLTDQERKIIKNSVGISGTYASALLDKFKMRQGQARSGLRNLTIREKCYNVTSLNQEGERLFGISIPISNYEVQINTVKCGENFSIAGRKNYYRPNEKDFVTLTNSIESSLFGTEQCRLLMEHIFPIRRYAAVSTLTANAALAGYNRLPDLMEPFKSLLGFITHVASNTDNVYGNSPNGLPFILTGLMDQAEFQKKMTDSFPGDTDDAKCLEFPDLSKEFWENFFKTLGELMKYFPSVLFRGLANKIDPMYKEMRAHYMNCELEGLDWGSLQYSWDPSARLVNGLNPKGKPRGTQSAKYSNLFQVAPDLVKSTWTIFTTPSNMAKTVSKLISYATTGAIPLIDLSSAFKVPCADIDENWLPNAKYDFGKYGRYGHPISPLTILAMSTLNLPSDIEKRDANCEPENSPNSPEVSEQECEDVE